MPDIKKWNGSAWVDAENKRWDGSNWVDAYTYKWDGSAWIQIYPANFTNKTINLNLAQNYKLNVRTGEVEYQDYNGQYHTTVDMIEVKPGSEYFTSTSEIHLTIGEYDKDGTYLKFIDTEGVTFTVSPNTCFIRIFIIMYAGTNVSLTGLLK